MFPGQGAQAVGMGRALHDASPAARAVFAEVDDALGEPLSALIFEGPAERLTLTANAQPALMATSLAAVRAVEERTGRKLADLVGYVAGHSLGEYTALAAAGAVSIARCRAPAAPARPGHAGGGTGRARAPWPRSWALDVADGRGGGRGGRCGRRLRARQRQWRGPAGDLGLGGRRRARGGARQGAWRAAQRHAAGVAPRSIAR